MLLELIQILSADFVSKENVQLPGQWEGADSPCPLASEVWAYAKPEGLDMTAEFEDCHNQRSWHFPTICHLSSSLSAQIRTCDVHKDFIFRASSIWLGKGDTGRGADYRMMPSLRVTGDSTYPSRSLKTVRALKVIR